MIVHWVKKCFKSSFTSIDFNHILPMHLETMYSYIILPIREYLNNPSSLFSDLTPDEALMPLQIKKILSFFCELASGLEWGRLVPF